MSASLKRQNNSEDFIGFPKYVSSLQGTESAEILMEALGPNLKKYLRECPGGVFSKTTVYKIIIQLIQRLKTLHFLGFFHNDLKLENILTGAADSQTIYIIDFGLTCKYLNSDETHIEKKFLNKFSGNFMFASLNSCRGNTKSRRDDI